MGKLNTPPVSPREPEMEDSDEEAQIIEEDEDFENNEEFEEIEILNEEEEAMGGDDECDEGEEIIDNSTFTFSQHNGSVFCCSLNPKDNQLVVSGGEDDKAFVWNITDGKVLFECSNHRDSVTYTLFSHDGVYLATADMSGFIQVWKVATKSMVWSFEIGDLNWMEWHPESPILFAGAVEGETWMWKIPSGDCKTIAGYGIQNECGKILPDGRRLAVGFVDGSAKVFDLKTLNITQQMSGHLAHTAAITSINCSHDNNLIVTGSLDATAKLFNAQTGKVLTTLSCENSNSEESNSVEAVSFCPDRTLSVVATGTLNGKISFWDIPSQIERQSYQQSCGVVKMVWHPLKAYLLFSAGLDGTIRLIDSRNGALVREFTGHTANVLDITVSNDGKWLVSSSDDQTCKVYASLVDT